jgi:hypothetical protein
MFELLNFTFANIFCYDFQDLNAFGYRNDLTRAVTADPSSSGGVTTTTVPRSKSDADSIPIALPVIGGVVCPEPLPITENCRSCLSMISLYEVGMGASEAATRAIAKRVCLGDISMSAVLIHQVRFPLSVFLNDFLSQHRSMLGFDEASGGSMRQYLEPPSADRRHRLPAPSVEHRRRHAARASL